MWSELALSERAEYKKMILAFASLTEMFAQKANEEDLIPSPIINSKYQETVFQRVFHANPEDIGNTSYDASIRLRKSDGTSKKYLIGIKTFGISSGDQKIAQFKAMHNEWSSILNEIQQNSINEDGSLKTKQEIDSINGNLYKELALRIATLRNMRIDSSEANLQGFSILDGKDNVEAVYHVLMPSKKDVPPTISVGETTYNKIDIENLIVTGCTKANNPTNFSFEDGHHKYKYTSADSQLLMAFNNEDIVVETWPVTYAEDAYAIFHEIANKVESQNNSFIDSKVLECAEPELQLEYNYRHICESYSWLIPVEKYSGFNNFYGVGSKLAVTEREKRIAKFKSAFNGMISPSILDRIVAGLKTYLLQASLNDNERKLKEKLRTDLLALAKITKNKDFVSELSKLMFRPADEMYIPIPKSKEFHLNHPNFFGPNIGTFEENSSKLKNDKEHCSFNLIFEPSGEKMRAFITQDNGKAIESCSKQSILGSWLRKCVFQLKEYEPLTTQRLGELGINGMRLYKLNGSSDIHLQFVYIDPNQKPADFISQ